MQANCTSALLQTSIVLSNDFILPRNRSTGFGYHGRNYRPFKTVPLIPFLRRSLQVLLDGRTIREQLGHPDVITGLRGYWFPYASVMQIT